MRIRRLFIANRGEIAVRIIRSCRRLGIDTVLGASEADLDSTPARLADLCVCVGPAVAAKSYLDVGAVVAAARTAGVDALHPGYGFLAENAALARACEDAGIVFVGPTPTQLEAVGDKLAARRHAVDAGLPVVPGGPVASLAEARELAGRIGWPILIKAVGGGGGRGLKRLDNPANLGAQLELAMSEAQGAFGDARVYLERYVPSGRHVEVQLLGDGHEVIHLGDRDCSVQRRYQKLIEEGPAPDLPAGLRARMADAAVAYGRRLAYRGAGTVEFLVDTAGNAFYFLEMNARIQVEHPVTEAITGVDLVERQIAIAEGHPLRLRQDEIQVSGHAIECRINAEDVAKGFAPGPGRISAAQFPAGAGIRVDTHVEAGSRVPPFYDSLVAKVIVHAHDRAQALTRMSGALANCRIAGVPVNTPLHVEILSDPEFRRGGVDTQYLARRLAAWDGARAVAAEH